MIALFIYTFYPNKQMTLQRNRKDWSTQPAKIMAEFLYYYLQTTKLHFSLSNMSRKLSQCRKYQMVMLNCSSSISLMNNFMAGRFKGGKIIYSIWLVLAPFKCSECSNFKPAMATYNQLMKGQLRFNLTYSFTKRSEREESMEWDNLLRPSLHSHLAVAILLWPLLTKTEIMQKKQRQIIFVALSYPS